MKHLVKRNQFVKITTPPYNFTVLTVMLPGPP